MPSSWSAAGGTQTAAPTPTRTPSVNTASCLDGCLASCARLVRSETTGAFLLGGPESCRPAVALGQTIRVQQLAGSPTRPLPDCWQSSVSALTAILGLLAVAALTVGTAIAVAAEFSLTALERSQIDAHVSQVGDVRARIVQRAHRSLSFQLSACQLAITITTLVTGYIAEPAIADQNRRLGLVGLQHGLGPFPFHEQNPRGWRRCLLPGPCEWPGSVNRVPAARTSIASSRSAKPPRSDRSACFAVSPMPHTGLSSHVSTSPQSG